VQNHSYDVDDDVRASGLDNPCSQHNPRNTCARAGFAAITKPIACEPAKSVAAHCCGELAKTDGLVALPMQSGWKGDPWWLVGTPSLAMALAMALVWRGAWSPRLCKNSPEADKGSRNGASGPVGMQIRNGAAISRLQPSYVGHA
jgi:hypothetical protein